MAEDDNVMQRDEELDTDFENAEEGRGSAPRRMMNNVMETVSGSDALRVVRDNPIPAVLIGAGIGWLIVEGMTGGRDYRTVEDYEEDPWQSGSDRSWSQDDVDELGEAGDGGASKAGRVASGVRDKVSDLAGRARGTISRGHDYVEGSDQGLGLWQAMERSPMGIGAIAFALGVAGGLAIPTTRWEDERMGIASERLKREAKGAARDLGQTARRVAKDAARAAGQDARNLGGSGTITERAKHVVQSAKDAAMEAAQREDLANSVRNRARGAVGRTKDGTTRDGETD